MFVLSYFNNTFLSTFTDNTTNHKKNPVDVLSKEIIFEIFYCLNLSSLSHSSQVNRKWKNLAYKPILWKTCIYRELAFTCNRWAYHLNLNLKDLELVQADSKEEHDLLPLRIAKEEFNSLPLNIVEEYRNFQKSAFSKTIKNKRFPILVRLPKKTFFYNLSKVSYEKTASFAKLRRHRIDESRWIMILPEGKCKIDTPDSRLKFKVSLKPLLGYRVPDGLEAVASVFATYFSNKKCSKESCFSTKYLSDNVKVVVLINSDIIKLYSFSCLRENYPTMLVKNIT